MNSTISSKNWRATAVLILCLALLHLVKPSLASAQTGYPAIDAQLDGACNNDPGTLIGVFLDADCTREYVLSGDALWLFLWIPGYALDTAAPYVNTAVDLAFWAAFEAPTWALGLATGIANPYITLATNTVWNTYGTAYDIADWNNDGTVDGGDAVQFPVYSMLGLPHTQNFVNEACGVNGDPFDTYNCPIRHAAAPTWAAMELYAQQFPASDTDGDGFAEPADFNGDGVTDARDPLQLPIYSNAGYGYTQQQVDRYCVENYNLTGCAIAHSLVPMYIAMEQGAHSFPSADKDGSGHTDAPELQAWGLETATYWANYPGAVAAPWVAAADSLTRQTAAHNIYGTLGYPRTQQAMDGYCGVNGETIESQACLISQAVGPMSVALEQHARSFPEADTDGSGSTSVAELQVWLNAVAFGAVDASLVFVRDTASHDLYSQLGYPKAQAVIDDNCGANGENIASSQCAIAHAYAPVHMTLEQHAKSFPESDANGNGVTEPEEGQAFWVSNGDSAIAAQARLLALQTAEAMEQNGAPLTAQAIREACDQPGAGTAELATSDCTAVIALAPSMFAVERTESQLVDSGICEEGQSTEDCTASQLEPGEPMNFDEHRSLFGDGTDAATIPSVLHIAGNGAIDALNALAANDAPGAAVSVAVAYQALLDYSLAYGSVYEILSIPAQVIQDTLTP